MLQKKRVPRNQYLGLGAFTATLLFAGMHQKFVLQPRIASLQAQRAADFVTNNLQARLTPAPKSKTGEVGYGLDALLQEKLRVLLADSQTPPPIPKPLPLTHLYKQKPVLQ